MFEVKKKNSSIGFFLNWLFIYNSLITLITIQYFPQDEELIRAVKLTSRERRFIKFSSVEYDGQLYMTPQDFLESFVDQEPRRKYKYIVPKHHTIFLSYSCVQPSL